MRDTIKALEKQAHELQVHELHMEKQQLKQQLNEKNKEIWELKQQKETLTKDFQVCTQENEQVVNALQNSVEMKDAALQAKDRKLQAKDAEIQDLQRKIKDESEVAPMAVNITTSPQKGESFVATRQLNASTGLPAVIAKEKTGIAASYKSPKAEPTFLTKPKSVVVAGSLPMGSVAKGCTSVGTGQLNPVPTSLPKAESGIDVEPNSAATRYLKLKWRDGPQAPFATCGFSVAVSGDDVFCCDACSITKVLQYNSGTKQWAVLPECPRKNFSIAVVNKQPTIIGGQHLRRATNTLLSLQQEQKWIEQLPAMKYRRNNPPVASKNTSLIVAGGWGSEEKKAVEVMDTQTLQWSTVASLPHPFWQATTTICGERLYIGGGFASGGLNTGHTDSVLMCYVNDLLYPQPHSNSGPVWKEIAPLPLFFPTLVTFHGQLLVVGGCENAKDDASITPTVRQFNAITNSWNVISKMMVKRCHSMATILPNNKLMICGGKTPNGFTATVEIASLK